ncbi:glycoside hydrolase family 97 protein [Alteromonas gilva]|uniref:Glycoside hydrolase family 97 catalytic domain-containing protein n=1 Tax=Alteromonas gilva TaxID=2987522 RepID=A0ABT5L1J5_9ALTE|nr:glycoside hydrolase family 97 protein [Alteromonas gilva]MDC8829673.1 glycoside hydrolase family 97 catalytic domain-containing protein [Alteromonas gilva]
MFKNRLILTLQIVVVGLFMQANATTQALFSLKSPDSALTMDLTISEAGALQYQLSRHGETVIKPSRLGIELNNTQFLDALSVAEPGEQSMVHHRYELIHGKQSLIEYAATERAVTVTNNEDNQLTLRFRLSNDGLAYRYELGGESADDRVVTQEHSAVSFYASTEAWLQPKAAAQSGWMNTNPSYEEEYLSGKVTDLTPAFDHGWVYPALFKYNDHFVLLSEAGIPAGYAASHLISDNQGNVTLSFPHPAETVTNGALLPQASLPFHSPWRLVLVGDLASIAESTLGTDLAEPLALAKTGFVKPGVAAWSWGLLKDDSVVYPVQKEFIDYAADMRWPYVLVDVNWDQNIGYQRIAELADYARQKQVRLWLWYNSSGAWNQTVYSPKSALLTRADRRTEFARLQHMGIAGIKVDFFPGDGAAVWDYFKGILRDAADFDLMVNFHGVTLPRGLQRTYPNLMTAEAIKGQEMITFFQDFADRQAYHATLQPFTRNVFDPMDFTPLVLGDIPNIERRTSNTFELAETILFYSGVQHLVTTPAQMANVEPHVKAFLQHLPTTWDETRFIAGYPGEYVVMARRKGCQWYIAGINAQSAPQQVVISKNDFPLAKAKLLTQGKTPRDTEQHIHANGDVTLSIAPNGGFVLTTQREKNYDCEVD